MKKEEKSFYPCPVCGSHNMSLHQNADIRFVIKEKKHVAILKEDDIDFYDDAHITCHDCKESSDGNKAFDGLLKKIWG